VPKINFKIIFMSAEIAGKIKVINPTKEVSNSFKKREIVVTTNEQYPQHILIDFIQDKCTVLDSYKVGEEVLVSINIRGKEHTTKDGEVKYFNQLQGWKIERTGSAVPSEKQ
jgi:hypothetical protein